MFWNAFSLVKYHISLSVCVYLPSLSVKITDRERFVSLDGSSNEFMSVLMNSSVVIANESAIPVATVVAWKDRRSPSVDSLTDQNIILVLLFMFLICHWCI
jgi:hypothetical protein